MPNVVERATTFESGNPAIDLASATNATIQSVVRHSGTYALQVNRTTTQTGFGVIEGVGATGAQGAIAAEAAWFSFYFRADLLPAANTEEIVRCNTGTSTTLKCAVRINSEGKLVIYDILGVAQATSTTKLSKETWYRIDFQARKSEAGLCEVRIWDNADNLLETVSAPACNMGATTVGNFRLGKAINQNGNSVNFFYDDVWLDLGEYAPARYAIGCLMVAANGEPQQWTSGTGPSNYTQINETPASTAEYVASDGTAAARGAFSLQSFAQALLGKMTGNLAIAVIAKVLASDAGAAVTNSFQMGLKNASGETLTTAVNLPANTAPGDYALNITSVLGTPLVAGGGGGSGPNNEVNGKPATGLGCGGGGAGFFGGHGGEGLYGGGGGGAAGYTEKNRKGGKGGGGFIVFLPLGLAPDVRTSGSSYTVPAGVTSLKVWVCGAGGGGAGSTNVDTTSGGAGGAGGVAYKTFSVAPGDIIPFSIGAGGAGGIDTASGSEGGETKATIGATTLVGKGGKGGSYNDGKAAEGGGFSGGEGGANGGNGSGAEKDTGGGGGGGVGGGAPTEGGTAGDTGGKFVDVGGLGAALSGTLLTRQAIEALKIIVIENTAAVSTRLYWASLCVCYVRPREMEVADSITFADNASKRPGLVKADSLAFADAVVKVPAPRIEDTLSFSDSASRSVGLTRADHIDFDDSVSKRPGLNPGDALEFGDGVTKMAEHREDDSIEFGDDVGKAVGHVEADEIVFEDSLGKRVATSFADAIEFFDDAVRSIGVRIADFFGFSDSADAKREPVQPALLELEDHPATELVFSSEAAVRLEFEDELAPQVELTDSLATLLTITDEPGTGLVLEDFPAEEG